MTTPRLTNLREVGGPSFQEDRRPDRRVVYRANTEPGTDPAEYPASVAAVIDLRRADEIDAVPHPLASSAGYRNAPLFDPRSDVEADPAALTLEEQYDDWTVRHRRTLALALRAIAEADSDVLICCSAGKDRTGIVSALLARLWGADLDRVGRDYAATGPNLAARFARERAESTDPEQTARMQRCVPEIAVHFIETVESAYGSVAGYLRWLGLTDEEIERLWRRRCCAAGVRTDQRRSAKRRSFFAGGPSIRMKPAVEAESPSIFALSPGATTGGVEKELNSTWK